MAASEIAMTSVGTTIAIALGAGPTALTAAAWATLADTADFKEIDVGNIGEFGPETNILTRTPLKTGEIVKGKGSTNFGDAQVTGEFIPADEGQIALQTAEASPLQANFCVTYQDGAKEYFRALVTSFKKTVGGAEDWHVFSSNLAICSRPVYVPAP